MYPPTTRIISCERPWMIKTKKSRCTLGEYFTSQASHLMLLIRNLYLWKLLEGLSGPVWPPWPDQLEPKAVSTLHDRFIFRFSCWGSRAPFIPTWTVLEILMSCNIVFFCIIFHQLLWLMLCITFDSSSNVPIICNRISNKVGAVNSGCAKITYRTT